MKINRTLRLPNNQYYPIQQAKQAIFIHHTSGSSAKSAITWWAQTPEHIGVAYVIDRDGTVYEVFDPTCWSYHLGVKGIDPYMEQHSIGIELVSYGGLREDSNGNLGYYPNWPIKTPFNIIPKNECISFDDYRGYNYFQKYTTAQMGSLVELIKSLSTQFKIPLNNVKDDFWEYNPDVMVKRLPGVWSHTTVRKDKSDIFPQPELVNALRSLVSQEGTINTPEVANSAVLLEDPKITSIVPERSTKMFSGKRKK